MKNIILGDGGMGSELIFNGVKYRSHINSVWSALAAKEHPHIVKKVHKDFINAGCDYITINNYAITQPILNRLNIANELKDLTLKSIQLAKEAIAESGKHVLIAGSIPPLETSYQADLVLSNNAMAYYYNEIVEILKDEVDILICETMATTEEAKSALIASKKSKLPVWLSWTLQGNRINILPGGEKLVSATKDCLNLEPEAVLVNCCAANLVSEALKELKQFKHIKLGGYANSDNIVSFSTQSGLLKDPMHVHSMNSKPINEEVYCNEVKKWIDHGATIVGGCCRTRPSYISAMKQLIASL